MKVCIREETPEGFILKEAVGEPDVKDQAAFRQHARKNPTKYSTAYFVPVTIGRPFMMEPETQYGMKFLEMAPAKPAVKK